MGGGVERSTGWGTACDAAWRDVRHAMRVALMGALAGAAGALALARLLSGILYGVTAHDPLTFTAVVALLMAVATLASWIPVHRATRVAPLTALRGG